MVGDQDRPGVRLLGPVEVVRSCGTRTELQRQCRKVLALLVTASGRPVPTGQLVRSIWGDTEVPAHAPQMVRSHIRMLRSTLRSDNEPALTTGPAGHQLPEGACFVDAERFRGLLTEARRRLPQDAPAATRTAAAALGLWRGHDAMPDVADVPELRTEAARLEELRCQAEETVVLGTLLSGRAEQALPRARRLTELHPTRESAWRLLVLAEALSGRAPEATFRRARRHLTGPAPGLQRLRRELLNGVPAAELLRAG